MTRARKPKLIAPTCINENTPYIIFIIIHPASALPKIRNESDRIGAHIEIRLIGKKKAIGLVYLLKYLDFVYIADTICIPKKVIIPIINGTTYRFTGEANPVYPHINDRNK